MLFCSMNLIVVFAINIIGAIAFAPIHQRRASSHLSMIRLKMSILKIPMTSHTISNEIIDDNTSCINVSDGRKPFMGGNWKLNPRSLSAATTLAAEVNSKYEYIYRI